MKAFVTSIGEKTTELCIWALERNGFIVELVQSKSSFARKLKYIYDKADSDFVRLDADVIVNSNFNIELIDKLRELDHNVWWWQFRFFDWYKQDLGHGMNYIRREAISDLRANIDSFERASRPETELSRLNAFYGPRRFKTYEDQVIGLHGYANNDLSSVKKLKAERLQLHNYDFELAERLNAL